MRKVRVAPKGMGINDFVAEAEGFFAAEGIQVEWDLKTFRGTQSKWVENKYLQRPQDKPYTDVVEGYFARHKVKPGITGWAQINGWRGETDTIEKINRRVEHDLYYIENWSIFFDLYILLRTPFALFDTENAY